MNLLATLRAAGFYLERRGDFLWVRARRKWREKREFCQMLTEKKYELLAALDEEEQERQRTLRN